MSDEAKVLVIRFTLEDSSQHPSKWKKLSYGVSKPSMPDQLWRIDAERITDEFVKVAAQRVRDWLESK